MLAKVQAQEARDTPISFRVTASLKRALDEAARKDRRSTSHIVMLILEDAMRARKLLP